MGEGKKHILMENPKGRRQLGRRTHGWRMLLKRILKKWEGVYQVYLVQHGHQTRCSE
jgi:hypothetical protein